PKRLEWSDAILRYFAGDIHALEQIPTETGGTEFQQRVWKGLRHIPVGQTRNYLELAQAIGQPTAVRAVGMCNGLNPILLILPCHRVIGKNGKLTGYTGGLERKHWLLAHESVA
ncbi:MAG: methylated-DNA--[protein]-cysteine S-methyltransferase, partial [Deinococcales bacterium]